MKKILLSLGLIGIFGGLGFIVSASSSTSCKDVEFSNGVTACVNIEDAGTDRRSLTTDIDGGTTSNLRCNIMTPDSSLRSVSSCNGEFSYDGNKAGRIKLWIRYNEAAPSDWEGRPSSNSERTYPQWVYDFDNEERGDDDLQDSTSNGDLDNFYVTADDTTPSTSQYIDLTVKARDSDDATITDYTDSVNFKVYYRSSSSSSWTQTTSSTYYTMNSSYTDGYDFSSSDDGIAELSNFIKFKKDNYDYKVRVYAEDDTSIYKEITFNVGSTSSTSNGDLDNFYVTADDTTPSTSQYIDLTVKARDSDDYTITDYTDTVNFKVYYRSSSSSSRTQTTSSTYYTMDSSYTDGYDFTSSDDGIAELSNFIKFKKDNYDYKVRVYDENDTSIYKEITFNVGSSSSTSNGDLDNFYVTADDTTPSTLQRIDLTVKARDSDDYTITDYTDTINFKVYYRSSSSSSWTQTTSSTYYTMNSSYTDGYDFSSSDDGIAGLTNFIEFNKNNYDYKVRVYDENDTSIYKEITFNVGSSSSTSNGDLDNFYVTADDTTPSTSQYIDLTVKVRDSDNATITDYTDSVNFKVYYRSSSSYSWTQTTSSTYYTMNSSYTDGYDFSSSDDGVAELSNFIKFKKDNYDYKVRVYDENDTSIYKEITFNVGSTSSTSNGDLDNFYVTADDTTPSTSQYIDLTVKARDSDNATITDYTDSVNFKAYYRSSSSSSRTQTTSSTYYTMNSSYTDGYDFTSSNNGQKTFTNFIKFNKNNYDYKVRVYDENNTSIYKEITFTVSSTSSSSSSVDGFTSSELNTVESIYDSRDNMIDNLESTYSKLRNSSSRQNMSDDLKDAMKEIIDDDSNKTYDNFTDFYAAFLDWYRYTISIR